MNTIDIKGKELHFVKRVLNRQQYNDHFTIDTFNNERGELQWGKDFIANLEKKGLLRFENGLMYATDLAIRSINEKEKKESLIIEEYIIDDFEYAFLIFMNNRNEPVHLFDFPYNFKYHSKIDGLPVAGTTNAFMTWMDEIQKYITDPTIEGFILNHTGKTRFEKLKKEKELKAENESLDLEIKRQTITNTRFSRNIAYASLFVAGLSAFVPIGIWVMDKDDVKKTETKIPQLEKVMLNQEQLQKSYQDLVKILLYQDSSKKNLNDKIKKDDTQ